jgi:hypothetical protein
MTADANEGKNSLPTPEEVLKVVRAIVSQDDQKGTFRKKVIDLIKEEYCKKHHVGCMNGEEGDEYSTLKDERQKEVFIHNHRGQFLLYLDTTLASAFSAVAQPVCCNRKPACGGMISNCAGKPDDPPK